MGENPPLQEGGLGQAGLRADAMWVHSQSFMALVLTPGKFHQAHLDPFRRANLSVRGGLA